MKTAGTFLLLFALPVFPACSASKVEPPRISSAVQQRQLLNENARVASDIVRQFFPVRTECDEQSNTVVIRGSPADVDAAARMLEKLEGVFWDDAVPDHVFPVYLNNANAQELAVELNDMSKKSFFGRNPRKRSPTFLADSRTNTLFVVEDRSNEKQVRGLISELDNPVEIK